MCDNCFISDVKMVGTFENKSTFVFILLFLFTHRFFYSSKPSLGNFTWDLKEKGCYIFE